VLTRHADDAENAEVGRPDNVTVAVAGKPVVGEEQV
jgi:hypothetical protein